MHLFLVLIISCLGLGLGLGLNSNAQQFNVDFNAANKSTLVSESVRQSPVPDGMKLVWSDEFNSDGTPDPAKWGYDLGNGARGWGNSELQFYTDRPDNVNVKGEC